MQKSNPCQYGNHFFAPPGHPNMVQKLIKTGFPEPPLLGTFLDTPKINLEELQKKLGNDFVFENLDNIDVDTVEKVVLVF